MSTKVHPVATPLAKPRTDRLVDAHARDDFWYAMTSGTARGRRSAAAVGVDGHVTGPAAHVAAPVVLAVAAASDVRRHGHVTTATTHRPTAARSVIAWPTFPAPHTPARRCNAGRSLGRRRSFSSRSTGSPCNLLQWAVGLQQQRRRRPFVLNAEVEV